MASSLANRLKKESLGSKLAQLQKDYQDIESDYKGAGDTDERNRLQFKLDRKLEEIKTVEQELSKLNNAKILELVNILDDYFDAQRANILRAYSLSLPNRLIDKCKEPQNAAELIDSLQFPQQQNDYSYIDKFVGYFFLLEQMVDSQLKQKLKEWAETNIDKCQKLIDNLNKEIEKYEKQSYPVLLVAILEREGGYVFEAWLLRNLVQDKQYSPSDFEPLSFNDQVVIPTDETLSNVSELLKKIIAQSLNKCQNYLKQIQIFLPARLMNHTVDSWNNWQGDEEDDDDDEYATTIGDDYEVLLRCSERLKGNSPPVIKWRDKAYIFKSSLTQPAEKIFILGNSDNPKKLFKELKLYDEILAVKITKVFKQKEPGTLLWKAGLPIALWIRQQLPEVDNESIIDKMLQDCCLKIIPNKVKQERVNAFAYEPPESHIGRHLCLFWDDPNLLPPEQLLTQNNL